MIKGVIFDMDGTLLDTESLSILAWDYAGEKMGVGKAGFMVPKVVGYSTENANEIIRTQFGKDFNIKKFRKIKCDYAVRWMKKNAPPLKPGVTESLDELDRRGIPYSIATSTGTKLAKQRLKKAGLLKRCPLLIGGDKVKKGKPDPEIFEKARQLIGVDREECIVIEDSPAGAMGAHNGGFRVIMIPDLVRPDETVSSVLWKELGSLLELPAVIAEENDGISQ
ncbi:MAG: HAD family phosphatase [Ruminococcaceae bacterium]|nr:HAD family phosphatase [Oscillospiraceae bacterium]